MSYSISFIGKPENVVKALEENSGKLSGASKEEYDAALPHFVALVKENSNKNADVIVKIAANGHAYFAEGEKQYSNCAVTIEQIHGALV